MQILALANQKGGCGKTTVAINLASALAARGERVLLIDLDPQAHASLGLGQADFAAASIADVLCEGVPLTKVARSLGFGFQLIPGSLRVGEFEELAARQLGAERVLEQALEDVEGLFDWVILDCPTRADGLLAVNAIRASTLVVLVVETGTFALQGAVRAQQLFVDLAADCDREIDMCVLATLFDPTRTLAREILIGMQARFGEAMFDTVIQVSDVAREATAYGMPVDALAPTSLVTRQFAALANEFCDLKDQRMNELPRGPLSWPLLEPIV